MNTNPDLDVEHIANVCESVTTRPSTLRASGGEVTLLFSGERQRDRAGRALSATGYATESGERAAVHPHGLRITGWSTDALERRAAAIRDLTERLGDSKRLHKTAAQAIEAADGHWPDVDPYETATTITAGVLDGIRDRVGPLIPSDHPSARADVADQLHTVERLSDRLSAAVGAHFNAACVAASTYAQGRGRGMSADAASARARNTARAFIGDRFDIDAFVDAAAWAQPRHPAWAAQFAAHYARSYGGTDRDSRPPPADVYTAWSNATTPAPNVAAADFPHPPTTTPGTEQPARRTTSGSPSPGRHLGGSR